MPAHFLRFVVKRSEELEKEKNTWLDRFLGARKAQDELIATPKPTKEPLPVFQDPKQFDLDRLSEKEQLALGEGMATFRRELVNGLTEPALRNVLGLDSSFDAGAIARIRQDPDTALKLAGPVYQARLAEFTSSSKAFGGPNPVEPGVYAKHLLTKALGVGTEMDAWRRASGLTPPTGYETLTARIGLSSVPLLFGDPSTPDPVAEGAPALYGILSNESDRLAYLKHHGLLPSLFNVLGEVFHAGEEAVAASVVYDINALLAVFGADADIVDKVAAARHEGESTAQALVTAYRATKLPGGVREGVEAIVDPLNWVLAGQALGVARATPRIARGLISQSQLLSKVMSEADFTRTVLGGAVRRIPGEAARVEKRTAQALSEEGIFAPVGEAPSALKGRPTFSKLPAEEKIIFKRLFAAVKEGQEAITKEVVESFAKEGIFAPVSEGLIARRMFVPKLPTNNEAMLSVTHGAPYKLPPTMSPLDLQPDSANPVVKTWRWMARRADPTLKGATPFEQMVMGAGRIKEPLDYMRSYVGDIVGNMEKAVVSNDQGILTTITRKSSNKPVHVGELLASKTLDDFEGVTGYVHLWRATILQAYRELQVLKQAEGTLKAEQLVTNEEYFSRFYNPTYMGELRSAASGVRYATTQPFQKDRAFEFLADALKAGKNLNKDMTGALLADIEDVAQAIVARRSFQIAKDMGLVVPTKLLTARAKVLRKNLKDISTLLSTHSSARKVEGAKTRLIDTLGQDVASLAGPGRPDPADLEAIRVVAQGTLEEVVSARDLGTLPLAGFTERGWVANPTDPKLAEQLTKVLTERARTPSLAGQVLTQTNDFLRLAATTLDHSALLLQGLTVLFTHPDAWMKGAAISFENFYNPAARAAYFAKNATKLSAAASDGIIFGSSEFYAATAPEGGVMAKILGGRYKTKNVLLKPIEFTSTVTGKTITPFQRSFDTFGDVARFEMHQGLRGLAHTTDEVRDVVDYINHMTGIMSSARLGVSSAQRNFESLALFAPRYNRAGLALVKDIFQGGLRGDLARESLNHFLVSGVLSYIGIAKMLGQDPKLNPLPRSAGGDGSAFLTWELGGNRVGYGSWWLTLVKTLGGMVAAPVNEDGFFSMQTVENVFSPQRGAFTRALWGKSSVVAGTGVSIMLGQTFVGERIERTDADNLLLALARVKGPDSMPFVLQNFWEGSPDRTTWDRVLGTVAAYPGLRSYPRPLFEELEEAQAETIGAYYETEYGLKGVTVEQVESGELLDKDVPVTEQGYLFIRTLRDRDPKLARLLDLVQEDRLKRGDDLQVKTQQYFDEVNKILAVYDADGNKRAAAWDKGGHAQRLPDLLRGVSVGQSAALANLGKQKDYIEVVAKLRENLEKRAAKGLAEGGIFVGDLAYQSYILNIAARYELPVEEGGFKLPTGDLDWTAVEQAKTHLYTTYGSTPQADPATIQEYVEAFLDYRGPDREPKSKLLVEYEWARDELLTPYWKLGEQLFGREKDWPLVKEWLAGAGGERGAALEASINAQGGVRTILRQGRLQFRTRSQDIRKEYDDARKEWRLARSYADAILSDFWGGGPTGYVPASPQAADMLAQRRRQRAQEQTP